MLLKKRTQLFQHSNYRFTLLDAKYSILTRVSIGALLRAQRNNLRKNTSARTYTDTPPRNYKRDGPKHPKITLPYSNVVTTSAYTSYMRTRLLCSPNNLVWHLILLNAALALFSLFSSIVHGLLCALLITSPRYLNSDTFSISYPLQLKDTSMLIYIAFVFFTFIFNPFIQQNYQKAFNSNYRPSALCDTRTASSAKARKNIYIVAISRMYLLLCAMLYCFIYSNRYGYT